MNAENTKKWLMTHDYWKYIANAENIVNDSID